MIDAKNHLLNINSPIRLIKVRRESILWRLCLLSSSGYILYINKTYTAVFRAARFRFRESFAHSKYNDVPIYSVRTVIHQVYGLQITCLFALIYSVCFYLCCYGRN